MLCKLQPEPREDSCGTGHPLSVGRRKVVVLGRSLVAISKLLPAGVSDVLAAADMAALLAAVPAARMPGCGGKIGDTFAGAGIRAICDLQVCCLSWRLQVLCNMPIQV